MSYQSKYTGEQIDEAVGKALSASGGGGGGGSIPNAIFISNEIQGGYPSLSFIVAHSASYGPDEYITASNTYFCAVNEGEQIVIKPSSNSAIGRYSIVGECSVTSSKDTIGNYSSITISNISGMVFVSIKAGDVDPV